MHITVCRSTSAIFDSIIELPRTRYSSILIALDQVTVCGHITCENFSSRTIEWLGVRRHCTWECLRCKSLYYISRGAGLWYVSVLLSYLAQHLLNLSMID